MKPGEQVIQEPSVVEESPVIVGYKKEDVLRMKVLVEQIQYPVVQFRIDMPEMMEQAITRMKLSAKELEAILNRDEVMAKLAREATA